MEFNGVEGFTGRKRVQAWFAKPLGDGPFPAMLVLPGAGNGPRPAPVEHARHGYAALDVQVHAEPVDNPPELYRPAPENPFDDPSLAPDQVIARWRMELESYYDVANFADLVRCPMLVCCGMIDPVSSATGVFTLYNRLTSPHKKMLSMPVQGHDCSLSIDTYAWRWLDEAMAIR